MNWESHKANHGADHVTHKTRCPHEIGSDKWHHHTHVPLPMLPPFLSAWPAIRIASGLLWTSPLTERVTIGDGANMRVLFVLSVGEIEGEHQKNVVFTYLCFLCFSQAKKAYCWKAQPAWEKQSLLLFTYIFFIHFWLNLLVQTVYLHNGPGKHFGKYWGLLFPLFWKKVQKAMKK